MLARPWARAVAAVTSTLWASVSGRVVRLQLRPLHLGKSGMRGDIRCFRSDVHRLPTTPVDLGRRAFGAGGAVCDHWRGERVGLMRDVVFTVFIHTCTTLWE